MKKSGVQKLLQIKCLYALLRYFSKSSHAQYGFCQIYFVDQLTFCLLHFYEDIPLTSFFQYL